MAGLSDEERIDKKCIVKTKNRLTFLFHMECIRGKTKAILLSRDTEEAIAFHRNKLATDRTCDTCLARYDNLEYKGG